MCNDPCGGQQDICLIAEDAGWGKWLFGTHFRRAYCASMWPGTSLPYHPVSYPFSPKSLPWNLEAQFRVWPIFP